MKTEHIENMRKKNGINKGLGTNSSGLLCGFGEGYLMLLFLQSCVIRNSLVLIAHQEHLQEIFLMSLESYQIEQAILITPLSRYIS